LTLGLFGALLGQLFDFSGGLIAPLLRARECGYRRQYGLRLKQSLASSPFEL
jgi:hypothetical protein